MKRTHEDYMRYALQLARRGVGACAPNPSVGCVIVKNYEIISAEHTALNGRPHAESQAIANATESCKGADVYVTLEPCSHYGQTAPCAEALVKAGVRKVFIAQIDHDPRVAGKGAKMLADAHIDVEIGICYDDAQDINRGFFSRISKKRPFVTLKIATDYEGRYLPAKKGKPQWVSGEAARQYVHLLRANSDVIITSSSTAIADSPELTCRLPGLEDESPQRVLVDRNLRVPTTNSLLQNPPLWIFTEKHLDDEGAFGVKYFHNHQFTFKWMLGELGHEGMNNAMIEAGPDFAAAALKEGLVDEVVWIKSTKKLGKKQPMFLEDNALNSFTETERKNIGEDEVITFRVEN